MKTTLNIVVALHCEAKSLIHYFQLKKISHVNLPFSIFTNYDKSIHLIISGIGKVKMAAATTFLFMWTGRQPFACFLNIGIAGSSQFAIGEFVLAHKVMEYSTRRCWFPFTSLIKNKQQGLLMTYDMPQLSYPSKGMADMEGSAFFQTAACFVSQEHIQLVKVISDNSLFTMDQLNKEKIEYLIADNMQSIIAIIDYLIMLSRQESELQYQPELEKFQVTWHFTHTQMLQLKEYLRRWQIQIKDKDPWIFCQNEKNADTVINKIMITLNDYTNCLS